MGFLKWLGGIVVFIWLIGFIFNFAGMLIHWLLVVAAAVFLFDFFFGKDKKTSKN